MKMWRTATRVFRSAIAVLTVAIGVGCGMDAPADVAPSTVGETLVVSLGGDVTMEFVSIPSGTFEMGSETGDGDEVPVHAVTLGQSFFMGKFEVTQAQWRQVMGTDPAGFAGDDRPIESISWNEAVDFANAMSIRARRVIRLPTEAEWEFAGRAGTTTDFYFGDSASELPAHAWFAANSDNVTHAVGQKLPNAFGLYDMHGNVWEWCADWYGGGYYSVSPAADPPGPETGTLRVLRGGSLDVDAALLRSAGRSWTDPQLRLNNVGFRVVTRR